MRVERLMTCDGVDYADGRGYPITDVVIQVGYGKHGQHMPLDEVYWDGIAAAHEAGVSMLFKSCNLFRKDDAVVLVPEKRRDDNVLLLVEPTVPPGGILCLEAVTFDELEVGSLKKRVERRYHPFPGAGTELLRQGRGPNEEVQVLVTMIPGAAFRIVRGGKREGHYPVTVVAWKGNELSIVPAAKFHKQVERERLRIGWEHRPPYYLEPAPADALG